MVEIIKKIHPIKFTQALFYCNAVIWLAFSLSSLWLLGQDNLPSRSISQLVLGLVMFTNVAAYFLGGQGLGKCQKEYFYFAVLVLIINIILTVTDQISWFGFFSLHFNLLLLLILFLTREQYSN